MSDRRLNLPREAFEPVISQPIELDQLETDLELCFQDIGGPCNIKTCYGDICKVVNALRDYAQMLRMVCDEWELQGFHRATYECHADIGYDYDAAIEKCRRKMEKKRPEDDVGEEALALLVRRSQRAEEKRRL